MKTITIYKRLIRKKAGLKEEFSVFYGKKLIGGVDFPKDYSKVVYEYVYEPSSKKLLIEYFIDCLDLNNTKIYKEFKNILIKL